MKPTLVLAIALALCAPAHGWATEAPRRVETANRLSEGLPEAVPADLAARLQRYQNTRKAVLAGWAADGNSILIATRFGSTQQVHRVRQPGGAREQLTFYDEPINEIAAHPRRNGFVFGKDVGGSEFWQLYWFDAASREISLLTDGKSRNSDAVFSHDGRLLAYSSTARNGKDTDIWLRDVESGQTRALVTQGGKGSWQAMDFSADGSRLLVRITDEGKGFLPSEAQSAKRGRDDLPVFGRGLAIMNGSLDDVAFSMQGRQVTMIKRFS